MAVKTKSKLAKAHTVHRYRRIEAKDRLKSATYRCTITGCRHYLREEFMVGQVCECPVCGEEFEFTKAMLYPRKIVKPHCEKCTRATFNKKSGKVEKSSKVTLTNEDILTKLDNIIMGGDD
jgi:hypothetical protein